MPDSKVHGANMGPIWGRQDPGGPHVGPINLDIWDVICFGEKKNKKQYAFMAIDAAKPASACVYWGLVREESSLRF